MFATTELPPKETNGSVTPVSGITLVTPPMITNACRAKTAVSPAASSFENAVPGHHRGLEAAGGDQRVDQDHAAGAEEAELDRDHRVDEVGVRRGQDQPHSGTARCSRANGPGSFSSDSPRPWPKRPPSAWANSDCCTWPAPVGRPARTGRARCRRDRRTWRRCSCRARRRRSTNISQADDHVGEPAGGDVEQRQEGAEEHQRAAEVADEDEHQHRRAPDDQQRPEVLQRRDRQPERPAAPRPRASRASRAGSWRGR